MIEKHYELNGKRKLVEFVMGETEIDGIVSNVNMMEPGDCTGYQRLGEWEVRKGMYFYLDDVKPSGYRVTESEALYCDIVKKENKYELYISKSGKILDKDSFLTTNKLDVKELKRCLLDLTDEARKYVYNYYGVNTKNYFKKEARKLVDLSFPVKTKRELAKERSMERVRVRTMD